MIRSFQGNLPHLAEGVYIDDTALVIGDVTLGAHCSIWPMTVVRGDVNPITIGARTNVQDNCVLHVTGAEAGEGQGHPLIIGSDVTVGHRVVLHACTIGDECLIGMGAVVMDGAVLQPRVLLGAGSLVPPGKELEGGYLWLGSPVQRIRPLKESELAWFARSAQNYMELKNKYR